MCWKVKFAHTGRIDLVSVAPSIPAPANVGNNIQPVVWLPPVT